jgi:carbamoyltransferase
MNKSTSLVYFIGISCLYHDSAVACIHDGTVLVAVQEERFTRIKGDKSVPYQSLYYTLSKIFESIDHQLLKSSESSPSVIINIYFYESFFHKLLRLVKTFFSSPSLWLFSGIFTFIVFKNPLLLSIRLKSYIKHHSKSSFSWNNVLKINFLSSRHHLSHALSAHASSGFRESISLVLDGVGENHSTTLWHFSSNSYRLVNSSRFPNSLGLVYALITRYVGFKINSGEYKMMGLAPYGSPIYVDKLRAIIQTTDSFPFYQIDTSYLKLNSPHIIPNSLISILPLPPRRNGEPIRQFDLDLSASIQYLLEEHLELLFSYISHSFPSIPLTYSGGVALNCKANRLISTYFTEYFVQPAANDAGAALGAAWTHFFTNSTHSSNHIKGPHESVTSFANHAPFSPFLGPSIDNNDVVTHLDSLNIKYNLFDDDELSKILATQLNIGKIAGVCRDALEFGPRALGHRSIISSATDPRNQSIINRLVKKREDFRPFAPCVRDIDFDRYFRGEPNLYMLNTSIAKDSYSSYSYSHSNELVSSNYISSQIPSVVHVDLSARVQVVESSLSPFLYSVLTYYNNLSGCGVLINTSFNERGEPIVATIHDSLNAFFSINLDVLVLGNALILKEDNRDRLAKSRTFVED